MTFTFTLCDCNLNSSHCQMYSQSHRGGNQRGLTLGFIIPPCLDSFPDFLHCHGITTAQIYPHFTTALKAVVLLQSVSKQLSSQPKDF